MARLNARIDAIAAEIGRISQSAAVNNGGGLPPGPRTVEQVAEFLGVTPDTVRESYIPRWIEEGHMSEADKLANRWQIPAGFDPYRPK